MAPLLTDVGAVRAMLLRKHPLPASFHRCIGILPPECMRKQHSPIALGKVLAMQTSHLLQMVLELLSHSRRQHRAPIRTTLAMAHSDLHTMKIREALTEPGFGSTRSHGAPRPDGRERHSPRHCPSRVDGAAGETAETAAAIARRWPKATLRVLCPSPADRVTPHPLSTPQSPPHPPNPREVHPAANKPQLGFNRPSPHAVRGAAAG